MRWRPLDLAAILPEGKSLDVLHDHALQPFQCFHIGTADRCSPIIALLRGA
jgi:hypothetical protein